MQDSRLFPGDRLRTLQQAFSRAIIQGQSFAEVKKIYQQIKIVKRYLTGIHIE